jgi:hypothetical protein
MEPEEDGICRHAKVPHGDFIVGRYFKSCGLFKSHWQYDRELLEAQGQKRLPFATYGTVEKVCYDLPPCAQLADQDWTTAGFWPRTVQ